MPERRGSRAAQRMENKIFWKNDARCRIDKDANTGELERHHMKDEGNNINRTWLWRQAFGIEGSNALTQEQCHFKEKYNSFRNRADMLVSRIPVYMPGLTVHDSSHSDALWEIASLVAEDQISINPPEGYVLGAAILLHDAAMSVSAFPNGMADIKKTLAWQDTLARLAWAMEESGDGRFNIENPPKEVIDQVRPDVLRQLHAKHAEKLAVQAWATDDNEKVYLEEDFELRHFYGSTIGQIAHSHWWSVQRIEQEFSDDDLGPLRGRTNNSVDKLKLACLLRVADALHLDSTRAPRLLRAITNPDENSAPHWAFQQRLASPYLKHDAVVFTSSSSFPHKEVDAWWLAYDFLNSAHRELRDVDLLLQRRGKKRLLARRVEGVESPETLARTVKTRDWRPVNARLKVSDVSGVVDQLGGSKLYGDDPTAALRELIQNAADAVQARRKFEKRPDDWGTISVEIVHRDNGSWLIVEDNGIGMSEDVLTGALLDFGVSFWRSPKVMEEFPGLMRSGMRSIGRFGIGFFSVFMLGTVVRVISRRFNRGIETGRLLEFRDGTGSRPILAPCRGVSAPIDGGTRVEVRLKVDPTDPGGLLAVESRYQKSISLESLVGAIAPNLNAEVIVNSPKGPQEIVKPGDWLDLGQTELLRRLFPQASRMELEPQASFLEEDPNQESKELIQPVTDSSGSVFGRAFISPDRYSVSSGRGWLTVSGLRASPLANVSGILVGEAITASRNSARPLATKCALATWASKQAELKAYPLSTGGPTFCVRGG